MPRDVFGVLQLATLDEAPHRGVRGDCSARDPEGSLWSFGTYSPG